MPLLNTQQAAERLGISSRRIRVLIAENRLPAERVGRDWVIREADLEAVKDRPNGYPKGRKRVGSDAK